MRRVSFFLRTFLRAVKTSSSRRRWGLPGCRVGFDLSLFLRGHLRVGSVGVWEFICDIAFRAMLVASSKNNQKKHVWHGYLIDQCVWPVRLAVRLASAFGQCVWQCVWPVRLASAFGSAFGQCVWPVRLASAFGGLAIQFCSS